MKKHLDTVYDHFDTASAGELLKQVAIMLARRDQEYRDAYIAKSLQEQIAVEMMYGDQNAPANTHTVTVQFPDAGITEESSYRGRTVKSIIDGKDELPIEQYSLDVVAPVSTELAERVLSKLPRPLPTELDIEVRGE